jgi:DNA-directed RNA polymerase
MINTTFLTKIKDTYLNNSILRGIQSYATRFITFKTINRAFLPNLIHSLDASTLTLLIDAFFKNNPNKIKNFYAIHDCFGTTCNNMSCIISLLKSIYISLYSDKKYLLEIDKYMRNYIKDKIDTNFDINSENGTIEISVIDKNRKHKIITKKFPNINTIFDRNFDISEYIQKSYYLIN